MSPTNPRPNGPEDPRDEAQIAELIGKALGAPPPRQEFIETLGESLDAGLIACQNGVRPNGHSRNGDHTLAALVEKKAANWIETPINADGPTGDDAATPRSVAERQAADGRAVEDTSDSVSRESGRGGGVPLFRGLAPKMVLVFAAACLLIVGVWSDKPGYSWSSMLKAMSQQAWVRVDEPRGPGATVVRWVAVHRGVRAMQDASGASITDADAGTLQIFDRGGNRVTQTPLPQRQRKPDVQSQLVSLLLGDAALDGGDLQITEGRPRVTDQGVELEVTIRSGARAVRARFVLDPGSHLPKSCQLLGEEGAPENREKPSVQFTFPAEGPRSIQALGAPQDVQVVAMPDGDSPDARIASAGTPRAPPKTPDPKDPPPAPKPQVPELPPAMPPEALVSQLDAVLGEQWSSMGVEPAAPASDEEFVRRVYLDLTGRVPTIGEARLFLEDTRGDRRVRLLDELLESRDHATHLAAVWRRVLIPDSVDTTPYGGPQRLDEWLADRFQKNLPYDQLTAELLTAEGRISESGPLLFYAALKLNPEEIAGRAARTFLGTQFDCAQCHDHLFDERISQHDFWGFAALFAGRRSPRQPWSSRAGSSGCRPGRSAQSPDRACGREGWMRSRSRRRRRRR